jgi:periplasmic protein TonB
MPEGGFLEQKPRSPTSLLIVVALHGAAITALALSKMEVIVEEYGAITATNIPIQPPPPENPPEPIPEPQVRPKSQLDTAEPLVRLPRPQDAPVVQLREGPVIPFDPGPPGDSVVPADPPRPMAEPVRLGAQMDPRSELQPPYPASEQRAGSEGTVVVLLTIGTDGRVTAVRRILAASDAFWRATERHALRHWRFKPATVDGVPVVSTKRLTVHFRMDA